MICCIICSTGAVPCVPLNVVQMSASFTQQGGSHISYEDKLTTKVIPLMLMAFTAAAAVIGNLFVKRRREGGGMHPTLQFMLAALGMHWVFLLVHTLHLRSFAGGFDFGSVDQFVMLGCSWEWRFLLRNSFRC